MRGERAGMSAEQLTRMQQAGSNILLEMEDFSTNVYAKEQIAVKLFAQKALFSFLELCFVLAKYSILALGMSFSSMWVFACVTILLYH